MGKKTDNRSLPLKVKLRRWVLDQAQFPALQVWDLCAGEGHVWREMRKHFQVSWYTPCDIKPRMAGTVKSDLTPRCLDAFKLDTFNTVDIDPYGSPWGAFLHLVPKVTQRTAFFLTSGYGGGPGGTSVPKAMLRVMGVPDDWFPGQPRTWLIPNCGETLVRFAVPYCLDVAAQHCTVECCGRIDLTNVSYYGLLLAPK